MFPLLIPFAIIGLGGYTIVKMIQLRASAVQTENWVVALHPSVRETILDTLESGSMVDALREVAYDCVGGDFDSYRVRQDGSVVFTFKYKGHPGNIRACLQRQPLFAAMTEGTFPGPSNV